MHFTKEIIAGLCRVVLAMQPAMQKMMQEKPGIAHELLIAIASQR